MSNRYIVPAGLTAMVVTLSLVLIVVVIVRPWGGPDISWRTHLNLTEEPIDNYSRNIQTFVTTEGAAPIAIWQRADCNGPASVALASEDQDVDLSACSADPVVEWVAHGCAACHGLQGAGGIVGPNVQEVNPDEFSEQVRFGANGMPAFGPSDLSDEHIALLSDYLQERWLSNFPGGIPPTPTPTPAPTPVPTVSPTATADPVSTPAVVETVNDLFVLGKLVYEETAGINGCAECHGLNGKGQGSKGLDAPDIRGASRSEVREALRGAFDMSDIKLTSEELAAVIEYLKFLR